MNKRDLLRSAMVLLTCLPLIQCSSGEGIAGKIDMEFYPSSPIVILSDFTLNPGDDNEKKITGPWFAVGYRITNNSDKNITIQSLRFKVSGVSTTGSTTVKEVGIDPSDYEDFVCTNPRDSTYLETVEPGETIYTGDEPTQAVNPLAPGLPCFKLYISGLDKNVQTYSYQVEVSLEGWVGTPTAPVDRLSKTIFFSTQ